MTPMIPYGLRQLFGGMREGHAARAAAGTAILVIGLMLKFRPPKKERLTRKRVKEGTKGIRVRIVPDTEAR